MDFWDYSHDYVLPMRERKRPIEFREHGNEVWFDRVLVSIESGIPVLLHACATSRAVTLKLFEDMVFDTPTSGAQAIRTGLKKILRDNYHRAIRDPTYVPREPINSQQYQGKVLMEQMGMYCRLREAGHRDLSRDERYTWISHLETPPIKAGYIGYDTWNALESEVVRSTRYHKWIQ